MRIDVVVGDNNGGTTTTTAHAGWQWSTSPTANLNDVVRVTNAVVGDTIVDTTFRGFSYQIALQFSMSGSGGSYRNLMPINGISVQLKPPNAPRKREWLAPKRTCWFSKEYIDIDTCFLSGDLRWCSSFSSLVFLTWFSSLVFLTGQHRGSFRSRCGAGPRHCTAGGVVVDPVVEPNLPVRGVSTDGIATGAIVGEKWHHRG
jgi:hypothetical protein